MGTGIAIPVMATAMETDIPSSRPQIEKQIGQVIVTCLIYLSL